MTPLLRLAPIPLVVLLVTSVGPSAPLSGQAPAASPSFEVASIKRNNSGTGMMTVGMQPGGRLNLVNVPLQTLIVRAYEVQPFQIIGGPGWIRSDRFDVIAKAETDVPPAQLNLMLQTLLAERFKLALHRETREADIYELVTANGDGRLGPELKPAAVDCAAARGRGPIPGPQPGPARGRAGGGAGCQMMVTPGRVMVNGQTIDPLARTLSVQLGRPVLDKTGLTGAYDFVLSWTPEGRGAAAGPLPPGAPALPPIDPNGPSLFTALQEQLGLKLEPARGPMEVLVIDGVEPPTED